MKVVFCGGCNPEIDRGALAQSLADEPLLADAEVTVHLSGCSRACASGQQLTVEEGAAAVVVAGHLVDAAPAAAAQLAAHVKETLARLAQAATDDQPEGRCGEQ